MSDTHTNHDHEPILPLAPLWQTCKHCGCEIEPEVCEICGGGGERRCDECDDTGVARWVEVKT